MQRTSETIDKATASKKLIEAETDNFTGGKTLTQIEQRVLAVMRIIANLEPAIRIAYENGNRQAVEDLQTRKDELEELIKGYAVEEEDSPQGKGQDDQDEANQTKDDTAQAQDNKDDTAQAQDKVDQSQDEQDDADQSIVDISIGGKSLNGTPKKLTIDQIANLINRLPPLNKREATMAVNDVLNKLTAANVSEALRPMPAKTIGEMSNNEFNDMLNNIWDEIDKIIGLPPAIDDSVRKASLQRIADMKNNPREVEQELRQEDEANSRQDKEKQAQQAIMKARAKERLNYGNIKPLSAFKLNLDHVIYDQVKEYEEREESFSVINKQYEPEGIIKKGVRKTTAKRVDKPSIDFYFDRSYSWEDDKVATDVGKSIVASLLDYQDQDLLDINIYYFAAEVFTDINGYGGLGTTALPKIIKTIQKNGSKNVVIMTDDDMYEQLNLSKIAPLKVDGYVWWLWRYPKNYRQELEEKITGKRGTGNYAIERGGDN